MYTYCRPSLFLLFTQDYLSEHSYSLTYYLKSCLLLPFYFLHGWSNSKKKKKKIYKKRNGHIGVGLSIEGGSNLLYTMIFKGWKEGLWSPELLGGLKCRGPDFKGRDLRPLFVPWSMDNYKLILSTTETAGIK